MSESSPKILALDPEPFIQELLRIKLEAVCGGRVVLAADEKEARKLLLERDIDLVILEILHPRLDAYRPDLIILHSELGRISSAEVYARLKRKEESQLLPVVCLAPERPRRDPESAACGDLYLELPLSGRKLVKVVENLLELK